MNQVVKQLHTRRKQSERELEKLNLAIKALTSLDGKYVTANAGIRRKPKFSAAGLARIAAAQRARWKRIKALKK
jgi:hypothetical protein